MDLVTECYRVAGALPPSEANVLAPLILRAAACLPASIAEGHARENPVEFAHILSLAAGTLAELETHLMLCTRLGYLLPQKSEALLEKTAAIHRQIHGLRKLQLLRRDLPS
jgi:four helix bundle protein